MLDDVSLAQVVRVEKSSYQVRSDNRIQRRGLVDHPDSHGVNEHLIDLDIRKLLGHFSGNLIPHDHSIALSITLRDDGEQLLPQPRRLEREPHYTLHAVPRENRDFGRRLPWRAAVRSPALTSVLTLAVLADNHPVQIAGGAITKRRLRAAKDFCRSDVGVLLQRLTDR